MLDLKIDQLKLQIDNAAGQEHRIEPITTRAVTLLADRLGERWLPGTHLPDIHMERLSVPPMDVNLSGMTDEAAAEAIASALLDALALTLEV